MPSKRGRKSEKYIGSKWKEDCQNILEAISQATDETCLADEPLEKNDVKVRITIQEI